MKKCAFLSMDSLAGHGCSDHLLFEPMQMAGWHVNEVSWRAENVTWSEFEIVVIRSAWDYYAQPEAFLAVLETIDAQTQLENKLSQVKWNIDKTYLRDLESRGTEIVPTLWNRNLKPGDLSELFENLKTDNIVLKPVISANADDTFQLDRRQGLPQELELCERFRDRRYMAQPFVESIVMEGEYSLFYFGGVYSHSILKRPKQNDFRVQEDHGGVTVSFRASSSQILTAKRIIDALDETPLYARVDLVRTESDRWALMELELIEPSLYFDTDQGSVERFVKQFMIRSNRGA